MSGPLQAVIADQRGLNILSLMRAIEHGYTTPEGNHVKARISQGVHIDGMPAGTIRITDKES